ncbi:hypothetical protein Rcae01_04743 [Novipirellula caenicola]|uniref:Uncharacterized protein n=1 Tax=Novipirellula caenicola TaxID=1536901 RepID=A0ABP9VVQ8_9BACT
METLVRGRPRDELLSLQAKAKNGLASASGNRYQDRVNFDANVRSLHTTFNFFNPEAKNDESPQTCSFNSHVRVHRLLHLWLWRKETRGHRGYQ